MQKLHRFQGAEKSTLQPREQKVPSNVPFKGSRNLEHDPFIPRISALLADMEERGPMRSAAFRDIGKLAPKLSNEELWDSARVLLNIIRDTQDDSFERMEAISSIVPVLNAIRGKIVGAETRGIAWNAESQVGVQGALPKLHPGAIIHADREEEAAEKEKYEKMEDVREHALIGALNSVALVEIFGNKKIANAVNLAIAKLDSPHAKKLVNRRVLNGLVDPLGEKPKLRAEEPSVHPEKKASIEELFGICLEKKTDFPDME
jgi:hypothetical protein